MSIINKVIISKKTMRIIQLIMVLGLCLLGLYYFFVFRQYSKIQGEIKDYVEHIPPSEKAVNKYKKDNLILSFERGSSVL